MEDDRSKSGRRRTERQRDRLRAVPPPSHLEVVHPPRTIGRLIAQTALIADTARAGLDTPRRSNALRASAPRARRFGWFF